MYLITCKQTMEHTCSTSRCLVSYSVMSLKLTDADSSVFESRLNAKEIIRPIKSFKFIWIQALLSYCKH